MRTHWVLLGNQYVAAMCRSILAVVESAPGIYGAKWRIYRRSTLVETGESGKVQGAKVQATCAAKDWCQKELEG